MRKQNPPNARFWVWYEDDWVKLTLKPGHRLGYYRSYPTDEGHRTHWVEWKYDSDGESIFIERESGSDENDCDGQLERHYIDRCLISQLKYTPGCDPSKEDDFEERSTPDWEFVSASQRDHEAEKAGY